MLCTLSDASRVDLPSSKGVLSFRDTKSIQSCCGIVSSPGGYTSCSLSTATLENVSPWVPSAMESVSNDMWSDSSVTNRVSVLNFTCCAGHSKAVPS